MSRTRRVPQLTNAQMRALVVELQQKVEELEAELVSRVPELEERVEAAARWAVSVEDRFAAIVKWQKKYPVPRDGRG